MGSAYRRGSYAIALVVLPLGAFVFVLAPEMIEVVLGQQWRETVSILQIFSLGMLFRTAYPFSGTVARSAGSVYRLATRQAVYGILVLCGAWFGMPWGLDGIAIGVTVAVMIQYLMMVQLSMAIVDLRWSELLTAHVPALALAAVVALEAYGVAYLTRAAEAPAVVTLLASGALIGVTVLGLLAAGNSRFLGPDGVWIVRLLFKSFAGKLPFGARLKRRVLGHAAQ
jgi:PST family polysaccharide transporter